jgi:omega-hydroxy-beta-dihydromenaquinone-9 sulfotransferase
MTTTTTEQPSARKPATTRPHEWTPRIWEGCDFIAWIRLLARNRFAVGWRHLYIAIIVTIVSFFHMLLRWLQQVWYGKRIKQTPITNAPIFIIGHWRTGTTLLHELMILDPRHTYPNTYQCMEPNHFLLTEELVKRYLWFLMPSRRPMDNMAAGWDRPQEDEFALCMMGVPSPYMTIAFPNRPSAYEEYLTLEGLSDRELSAWKKGFFTLIQRLSYRDSRRLVLKSPPHSCRIKVLLELFPDARFVHVVRNPYVVYPSTVNLWKSLYQTHGLQTPTFDGLEEHVFTNFVRLYDALEKGKRMVDPSRYYELKYEELVRDPVEQMRLVYDHLELPGFDDVLPKLEEYVNRTKGYETNQYELPAELREKIRQRWGDVIRWYGYDGERTDERTPANG